MAKYDGEYELRTLNMSDFDLLIEGLRMVADGRGHSAKDTETLIAHIAETKAFYENEEKEVEVKVELTRDERLAALKETLDRAKALSKRL